MKQPVKKKDTVKKTKPKVMKKPKFHPKYGTSKLEEDFAHNFLDKLGLEYAKIELNDKYLYFI